MIICMYGNGSPSQWHVTLMKRTYGRCMCSHTRAHSRGQSFPRTLSTSPVCVKRKREGESLRVVYATATGRVQGEQFLNIPPGLAWVCEYT